MIPGIDKCATLYTMQKFLNWFLWSLSIKLRIWGPRNTAVSTESHERNIKYDKLSYYSWFFPCNHVFRAPECAFTPSCVLTQITKSDTALQMSESEAESRGWPCELYSVVEEDQSSSEFRDAIAPFSSPNGPGTCWSSLSYAMTGKPRKAVSLMVPKDPDLHEINNQHNFLLLPESLHYIPGKMYIRW